MIYSQSLHGTAVELVAPSPAQVDFREIAETLAHLNRYAGAASPPVSVGLHTLIVIDVAPGFAKPYAALHDAHEARIGDIISPTVRALREIAAVEHGVRVADALEDAIEELKRRHERAIWEAAGLAAPTDEITRAVATADRVALMTEQRFFLVPPQRPWREEAVAPLARRPRWRAPDQIADELFARFIELLPALAHLATKDLFR
jgi:5'-deoxynucleotidase YfbR-like HD superfamily hydrolase